MVYLAYRCTNNSSFIDKENAAIQFILASQDPHGTFGNEYSTALALQVHLDKKIRYFTICFIFSAASLIRKNKNSVLKKKE